MMESIRSIRIRTLTNIINSTLSGERVGQSKCIDDATLPGVVLNRSTPSNIIRLGKQLLPPLVREKFDRVDNDYYSASDGSEYETNNEKGTTECEYFIISIPEF